MDSPRPRVLWFSTLLWAALAWPSVCAGRSSGQATAGRTNAPVPLISSLDPQSVTAGGPPFALTISGVGFVAESRVYAFEIKDTNQREASRVAPMLAASLRACA